MPCCGQALAALQRFPADVCAPQMAAAGALPVEGVCAALRTAFKEVRCFPTVPHRAARCAPLTVPFRCASLSCPHALPRTDAAHRGLYLLLGAAARLPHAFAPAPHCACALLPRLMTCVAHLAQRQPLRREPASLRAALQRASRRFTGFAQQDAHEALMEARLSSAPPRASLAMCGF